MGTAVVTRKQSKPAGKTKTGGQPVRKRRAAAVAEAQERRAAPEIRANPMEVLQETLDVMVSELRYPQMKVDALGTDELWAWTELQGKIPSEWIRLRDEYLERLTNISLKLVAAGIADRQVRVAEAQMVLVQQTIRAAAERAGLSPAQVRALGAALREEAVERLGEQG